MSWTLEDALSYYKNQGAPSDQSMVISLFREVQEHSGGSIPHDALTKIAQAYNVKETFLSAIIKRIPSLRISDEHTLELCSGPNCGKHKNLSQLAEKLQKESGGKFKLKYVQCMRMCGKGPNLRWDGTVYNKADEELLRKLIYENN